MQIYRNCLKFCFDFSFDYYTFSFSRFTKFFFSSTIIFFNFRKNHATNTHISQVNIEIIFCIKIKIKKTYKRNIPVFRSFLMENFSQWKKKEKYSIYEPKSINHVIWAFRELFRFSFIYICINFNFKNWIIGCIHLNVWGFNR